MRQKIFLFDIDGVLIQPGGYRISVNETVKYFTLQMGLGSIILGDEVPEQFEALGITSEWDMVPISLAIILDQVLSMNPESIKISTLNQKISLNGRQVALPDRINYPSYLGHVGNALDKDDIPSMAVYKACRGNEGRKVLPNLYNHPILDELLTNTRRIDLSLTTQLFQNYVLGAKTFQSIYKIPPIVDVESHLTLYDQVYLDLKNIGLLKEKRKNGDLLIAAITARNSLPPREINVLEDGFAPEAEMALDLLGMSDIPLMGYGKLSYIARRLGIVVETILKPSPVQALAAIAAAVTGEDWPSLQWAVEIGLAQNANHRQVSKDFTIDLPRSIDLHVFEDSPVGIKACKKACEILRGVGIDVHLYPWGISESDVKITALKAQDAQVCADVNRAIEMLFNRERVDND